MEKIGYSKKKRGEKKEKVKIHIFSNFETNFDYFHKQFGKI